MRASPFPSRRGRGVLAFLVSSALVAFAAMLVSARADAAERSVPSAGVTLSTPAEGALPRGNGRLRILAIGVNDAGDPFFPKLKWAESDARALAGALGRQTERAPDRRVLLGPEATRDAVRAALAKLAREARPEDDVVIYFSGHGTLAVSSEGRLERVLVMRGTTREAPLRTGLTVGFLRDLLEAVPARRKAAIIASCHSGTGKSKVSDEVLALLRGRKGTAAREDRSEGVLVLAAAAREETAREDDSLGGDIYTHFLREGLGSSGDIDGDGSIDALEAHEYARRKTLAFTQGRQRPSLEASVIGEGEVVLAGRSVRRGAPMLQAYGEAMTGIGLKANGTDKGPGPQGILLQPGRNVIELYAEADEAKPVARYVVDASAGETLTLEDLARPMPFRLGVTLGVGVPVSEKTSRTHGPARLLAGGWAEGRLGAFALALGAEASSSHAVDLGTGVEGRLSGSTYPLRFSASTHLFRSVEGSAWVEGLYETRSLTLKDTATGDERRREASGLGWGAGVAARLPLAWRFEQEISLGHRRFEASFQEWGRVRSHRAVVSWTAMFAFGRFARRVR